MKNLRLPVILLCGSVAGSVMAQPTVPGQINYQGFFADATGTTNLSDGSYTMSFRIYNDATAGTLVWGPQIFDGGLTAAGHGPQAIMVGGRCNLVLGPNDTNGVSMQAALNGTNRFLEISVGPPGSSTNIVPRQQLLSAPYALRAASADSLGGFDWSVFGMTPTTNSTPFISGTRIQAASITINQIGTNAVGNAQLAPASVTGDKLQIPVALQGSNVQWLLQANNSAGPGLYGFSSATHGVVGQGPYSGVYGSSPAGPGVLAFGSPGIRASSAQGSSGVAGEFIGTLTVSGSKLFKIDHPLDPANKYLMHSCVESPDMKNIYDGVVGLDAKGEAVVKLPAWFEALNKDFRYQLTAIGAPGPNLHVAEEIANSRFKIAGGQKGMKVSWQVTGIRQDAWANAHRMLVEEDKPAAERGTYIAPEEYRQPVQKGLNWKRQQEAGVRSSQ